MKNNWILVVLVMLFLAYAIQFVGYDKNITMEQGVDTVKQIPLKIGEWTGKDYSFDPIVMDILETKAILHRNYQNTEGNHVFLSLVYYAQTKVDFHAPEECLGGQGIKTEKLPARIDVKTQTGDIFSLKINKLIQIQDKNNKLLVYYFYKTGSFMGRNYIKLRFNLILNKFKTAGQNGSLVRLSTPFSVEDNGQTSHEYLERFITDLFPYLVAFL
ncbi:EpsI family protein [Desulfocicer vacuolatum DSM 3385]|uniref:EpsI family protein n=1 Tax=Desulfocicer vacuolatum DSM 3385 TaxID=1121400 RepID=A0A1W1ZPN9_9BACT|nr:exosortase C-terminal domain/associated protein EpsI [Desulfocicer vacuolatum]SMC50364.1 EpsI family protein [Desulfocicer vacuolatum DSM 3385]